MASKKKVTPKPFHPPRIRRYGDVRPLTQSAVIYDTF